MILFFFRFLIVGVCFTLKPLFSYFSLHSSAKPLCRNNLPTYCAVHSAPAHPVGFSRTQIVCQLIKEQDDGCSKGQGQLSTPTKGVYYIILVAQLLSHGVDTANLLADGNLTDLIHFLWRGGDQASQLMMDTTQ